MKKILSLALVLVLIASVFAGCGTQGATKVITACVGPEPASIDPAINQAVDGATYLVHAFEGLTKVNKEEQIVPGQAASWKQSDDGLSFTFTLRDDAKWSDGQKVVAADFVYSWQRAVNPVTASAYAYQLYYIKNAAEINSQFVGADGKPAKVKLGTDGKPAKFKFDEDKKEFVKDSAGNYIPDEGGQYVEDANGAYLYAKADGSALWLDDLGVKATDEKTLEVSLSGPCSYFLQIAAFPTLFPVRKDVVEKDPEGWAKSPETYICNGPYVLSSWKHSESLVFKKSETYYDKATIVAPEIKFLLMEDENAILAAYKTGDLLLGDAVPIAEIPSLVKSKDCTIYGNLGTYYYVFNVNKAPFDNVKVRKALTLAIDRQYLTEKITQGGEIPAGGFVPLDIPDATAGADFRTVGKNYYDPLAAANQANITEAKKLLSEAGYPDGAGFPTIELKYNTQDSHKKIAEYIVNEWKKNLNINVTLANEEWSVFQGDRTAGNYEVARDGWLGDYVDPMTFLDLFTSTSGNNDAHWKNTEYDKLIDAAKKSSSQTDRMTAMHQAEDILMTDMPAMPIYFYSDPDLVSPRLKGYVHSALGFKYLMWASVEG